MLNLGFYFLLLLFSQINAGTNAGGIILPPVPQGPEVPICSSYSGLCNLMYNLTDIDTYQIHNSHQPICRCRGEQQCETDWFSNDRSITKVLKSSGQEVEVKMSYCTLNQPDNVCRQNEVAVVTRGRGPLTFEIASDFRCRCYRQMYAHRSWRDGDYDYIEYSCGKPRCGMNRTPISECTRITYNGYPNNLIHDYLCRCRRHEECTGGSLPSLSQPVTMRTCQRISPEEFHRRQEMRRFYRSMSHK